MEMEIETTGNGGGVQELAKSLCWICLYWEDVDKCQSCERRYHLNSAPCAMALTGYPPPEIQVDGIGNRVLIKCQECKAAEETTLEKFKHLSVEELKPILLEECILFYRQLASRKDQDKFYGSFKDLKAVYSKEKEESKKKMAKVFPTLYDSFANVVSTPMDLMVLENKVKQGSYRTLEQFAADVKLIFFNSAVFHGENDNETKNAMFFQTMALKHLDLIKSCCVDCLIGANKCVSQTDQENKDWMKRTCKVPHPVLLTKYANFPIWPTKVIGSVGKQNFIIFFGDYTTANVLKKDCKLSFLQKAAEPGVNRNPNRTSTIIKRRNAAFVEAKDYLQNVATVFGGQVFDTSTSDAFPGITKKFLKESYPEVAHPVIEDMLKGQQRFFQDKYIDPDSDSDSEESEISEHDNSDTDSAEEEICSRFLNCKMQN